MKRMLGAVAGVAMVAGLATGCGGTAAKTGGQSEDQSGSAAASTQSGEEPYIIWVNPLVGSAVFTQATEGLEAAADEYGFKLKTIGPSTLDDTQMVQAVENAISESPDLIVTTPYNYTALEQSYKKAAERGIPIVNISSDSPEDGRVAYVGTDNTKYGEQAAEYINEKTGGNANVMVMMANLDTSNQLEQKEAFEAKIAADFPGISVSLTDADKADPAVAVQKFQDAFRAHPEINTVLCLEGNCGSAAAIVAKEQNRTGEINILAIDDMDDTLQNIRDGLIWATMAQNFYKMGYKAGEYGSMFLKGEEVPSVTDSGTVLITLENIDTYQDEFYK